MFLRIFTILTLLPRMGMSTWELIFLVYVLLNVNIWQWYQYFKLLLVYQHNTISLMFCIFLTLYSLRIFITFIFLFLLRISTIVESYEIQCLTLICSDDFLPVCCYSCDMTFFSFSHSFRKIGELDKWSSYCLCDPITLIFGDKCVILNAKWYFSHSVSA